MYPYEDVALISLNGLALMYSALICRHLRWEGSPVFSNAFVLAICRYSIDTRGVIWCRVREGKWRINCGRRRKAYHTLREAYLECQDE